MPDARVRGYFGIGAEGVSKSANIGALLRSQDIDAVRKTVSDAIVEDIARILRLPKDDISRVRQLSEIGLDSLMGVELGASLQELSEVFKPLARVTRSEVLLDILEVF